MVGEGGGVGGKPFVEGDGEGEQLVAGVEGMDHLDVELGVGEGRVVEVSDVVEEIPGEGGVGVDDGAFEAEVVVVLSDVLVDGVVDGDGDDGDLGALRGVHGEEAAVDVFFGGGGDLVVIGGDELHAGFVELEGVAGVVGDDDADGQKAVLHVGHAEEGAFFGVVAGVGGDGDVLVCVSVDGGVFGGGAGGWSFLVGGEEGAGGEGEEEGEEDCRCGLFTSHLRR